MNSNLKQQLAYLAKKYETASFCDSDPSQFLRRYKNPVKIEAASFVAAMLSFGSRNQFIPKIESLLQLTYDNSDALFAFEVFPSGSKKFYRFYSYDDIRILLLEMNDIISKYGSLGQFVQQMLENGQKATDVRKSNGNCESTGVNPGFLLSRIICGAFPKSKIVPKGKTCANKRIFMFLRWMVRTDSPVDSGLWTWFSKKDLIMPLDVHVMEESKKLGLLPQNCTANIKSALFLTEKMKEIWPNDPLCGDFALFGLGVDSDGE